MALSNYFYDIEVYRQTLEEDDWGNESEDGAPWVLNQVIQGLLEPKNSSRVQRNNDGVILSDFLLYTPLETDVLSTDRFYDGEYYYSITGIKRGTGVKGRQSHQEFDLLMIGVESNS